MSRKNKQTFNHENEKPFNKDRQYNDAVFKLPSRIKVTAQSDEQKLVLKSLKENDITFAYGPPGTGKTHLAVGFALNEFLMGNYNRLLFTRPCVEAFGESIGFLPGDFNDKISPYMIPIFDILEMFLDRKVISKLVEENKIMTLPLAFHRGLTFNKTFVVADEMQNTVTEQMRMLLTRLGSTSKIAITGDPSQTDKFGANGLTDAISRLNGVAGIGIVELSRSSIVRHPLVIDIDKKYSEK